MMVGNRLLDLFAGEAARRRAAGRPRPGAPHRRARPASASPGAPRDAGADGRGAPRRAGSGRRRASTVIDRLDRDGLLPGDHVRVQPGRLRRGRRPVRAVRPAADRPRTRSTRSAGSSSAHTEDLPQADLEVLGLLGVARGARARHRRATTPGMLPAFKETVEELFVRGLVRVVFATETLALGINMPARTVVLERLVKYNGEAHVELTPGEYTQLTGRAGRRGIDVEGHAVVIWQPGRRPGAGRRARLDPHLPAAQLVPARLQHGGQPGRPARRRRRPGSCWSSRSRQFQADRSVVGLVAADRTQRRGARRLPRVDDLPPRRLHRVRRRCARKLNEREKALSRKNAADRRAEAAAVAARRCGAVT